ncbi:KICSTOR complex protein ITFG2-like isoform X2 [Argiope bruennichi]|uniref:KICSTOR complex protein ITFG2-like isoform X2 n=1 Tax=Argiope bruennichi TaxID=94029 RepID=UPI0024946FEB|nr:KICSTOR complex protein ITFG2-like isoform X2 [Argiope bruennichi]
MRAVSFVSRLEFEFKANVSKNAVCLGDADNDNDYELVIGNHMGDMAIFKGDVSHPWLEAHDLGMIMVIVVGDILNEGKNSIISISGEGSCSIFEITNESLLENERKNLQPFHVQKLPANTKVALLADVDNDGELELVLGLTDHVLRTYRWVRLNNQNPNDFSGKLVGLHKLELGDQIGSISLNPSVDGTPNILVAQAGGTYISFQCCDVQDEDGDGSVGLKMTTPVHHPLASSRMRSRIVTSEILGGLHGTHNGEPCDSLTVVATLDGTLMLVHGDETLWSFQVDHQLFSIAKLDLNDDGEEEVIACAWDGQTYMVNQRKQSVRFQFEDSVSAFTAGKYAVLPGNNMPVLVYVTYNDRIYVYYDIMLPSFPIRSFLEKTEQDEEIPALLAHFPIDRSNKRHLAELYSFCLYGIPSELLKNEDRDPETQATSTK